MTRSSPALGLAPRELSSADRLAYTYSTSKPGTKQAVYPTMHVYRSNMSWVPDLGVHEAVPGGPVVLVDHAAKATYGGAQGHPRAGRYAGCLVGRVAVGRGTGAVGGRCSVRHRFAAPPADASGRKSAAGPCTRPGEAEFLPSLVCRCGRQGPTGEYNAIMPLIAEACQNKIESDRELSVNDPTYSGPGSAVHSGPQESLDLS